MVATVRRETNGRFQWTEGALYPNLHKLERGGLISGQWQGEPGTRQRKYYRLTEAGQATLEQKTRSWNWLCEAVSQVLERSDEGD
jgi:DNA-binding PadR family transcriptional regulator